LRRRAEGQLRLSAQFSKVTLTGALLSPPRQGLAVDKKYAWIELSIAHRYERERERERESSNTQRNIVQTSTSTGTGIDENVVSKLEGH